MLKCRLTVSTRALFQHFFIHSIHRISPRKSFHESAGLCFFFSLLFPFRRCPSTPNAKRSDPIFSAISPHCLRIHLIHFLFSFDFKQITAGWVCCIPCVWLRTSATVHKIALTTATLLVTSLLVASPVLFLLSTAPSQLPKDCNAKNDLNCLPTRSPAPECTTAACRTAAISIQSRTNWKVDPCKNFKNFSCSASRNSLKSIRSAQEGVDNLMQRMCVVRAIRRQQLDLSSFFD